LLSSQSSIQWEKGGTPRLNEEKALAKNNEILFALCSLEKEEIRDLASDMLSRKFGIKPEKPPPRDKQDYPPQNL
jgi:16S rRNA C967 or C1407 C5-methylase (RsmB/RsmF family)